MLKLTTTQTSRGHYCFLSVVKLTKDNIRGDKFQILPASGVKKNVLAPRDIEALSYIHTSLSPITGKFTQLCTLNFCSPSFSL